MPITILCTYALNLNQNLKGCFVLTYYNENDWRPQTYNKEKVFTAAFGVAGWVKSTVFGLHNGIYWFGLILH